MALVALQSGEWTPGVYIVLRRYELVMAYIKPNPVFTDRVQWFFSGAFLLLQAFYAFKLRYIGSFMAAYEWIASVFGVVCLVSAFFPKFGWNKRLGIFKITILEIILVVLLAVSVIL